ncbi:hypothetical protein OUZ56_032914 [Daphnia magna]|uniref:Uncharacterized protein n=1 Tax=Daphnia magna TaxID=35525 RepID=A0ABQ9ZXG9_9CRUS|nr:hypothetical protein OUZ56_032914 [Daphnia magna]
MPRWPEMRNLIGKKGPDSDIRRQKCAIWAQNGTRCIDYMVKLLLYARRHFTRTSLPPTMLPQADFNWDRMDKGY